MDVPKVRTIVALIGGLALAFPAAAPAAQTIGQTGSDTDCAKDQAYVQSSLSGGASYSPVAYGVITSWGAAADADANQPLMLLVLRHDGGTQWTALQKDLRTLTTPNALNTFTGMRLTIEAGQEIGIYLPAGSGAPCEFSPFTLSDTVAYNNTPGEPPLNSPFTFDGTDTKVRANVQAVVEPDADRDVFGDETQDKCLGTPGQFNGCPNTVTIKKLKQKGSKPKLRLKATVPGQGTLKAGSPSDPAFAAAAKVSLKPVTQSFTSTSKQQVALTLKLTKSAKARLADKGKLKLQVRLSFTPTGGPAGSQTAKAKLKS